MSSNDVDIDDELDEDSLALLIALNEVEESLRVPKTRRPSMHTKQLGRVEIKDAVKGEVSAVFATFDEIDADGDVTLPGAFDEGAAVPISAYGHKSWEGALPVGVGRIRTDGREAILDGQFFMDTTHGRDTFLTIKRLKDSGVDPQWSYGYDPVQHSFGERAGRRVRYLEKQQVHEVSPVLIGAGVNTRTLAAKSRADNPPHDRPPPGGSVIEYKAAIRPHQTEVYNDAWDASAVVGGIPDTASVTQLRSMFAWVDSNADPETKGAYRFPHHSTVEGPANLRACIAGIAALNGARGGTSIPDGEARGVYEHLGSHLRDADREPPEYRKAGAGGVRSLNDLLAETLVTVSEALDAATRALAMRAEKGKQLTAVNAELLEWLGDDLTRLRTLVDSPEEDMLREFAAYVARQHRFRTRI